MATGAERKSTVRKSYTQGGRLLLGKAIPCVGRDRELATLEAALDESIEEGVARAVLVTGAPGIGKTRMAEDLVARAAARHPALLKLVARAVGGKSTERLTIPSGGGRLRGERRLADPARIRLAVPIRIQ